jgi:hypothetical protein
MSIASLVLFAALAAAPAEQLGATALVAKLGSAEPAERAAASEALKALGRGALPALEKAMKADHANVRERASALWEAIQRDLMTRPSLVRLDGRDRPLAGVLEVLESQTSLTLRGVLSAPEKLVALREPTPVPFWTALERLGLCGIHYHILAAGQFPRLELRAAPAPAFTSTAGPFRVILTGLHLHRDRHLIRGSWVRIDRFGQRVNVPREDLKGESAMFFGGLKVMVEPRMWFTQEAPARLIEATNDLGQSLVPEAGDLATTLSHDEHFAFRPGSGQTQTWTEFRLRPTDKPGRVARLRGVVPVMLHVGHPEPTLVIPLAGAAGKTFRCDDAEFAIRTVNDSPTATRVSLNVRLNVDKAEPARQARWRADLAEAAGDGHSPAPTNRCRRDGACRRRCRRRHQHPVRLQLDDGHLSEWPCDSPALSQHAPRPNRGGLQLPGRAIALRAPFTS